MVKIKKTIVIKIGSSILMNERNSLDEFLIAHIADQISSLRKEGFGVVLVVSGAVACGHKFIDFSKDQKFFRQAASGLGQAILTSTFTNIFSQKKMQVAQLLLTKDNFYSSSNRLKVRRLLEFYTQLNFIAIINENDMLDLNSFGGNDLLAAEITSLLKANKLLILSTMKTSTHGVGGGQTKQKAIDILSRKNIEASIINGKSKDILLRTLL